jgi:hypothetical protein
MEWWWPKPHEAIDVEDNLIHEIQTPGRDKDSFSLESVTPESKQENSSSAEIKDAKTTPVNDKKPPTPITSQKSRRFRNQQTIVLSSSRSKSQLSLQTSQKSSERVKPTDPKEKLKKTALLYQKTTKPNRGKSTSGADDIIKYFYKLREK